jgi:hypothetical protein
MLVEPSWVIVDLFKLITDLPDLYDLTEGDVRGPPQAGTGPPRDVYVF